jgi:hypothetical protein
MLLFCKSEVHTSVVMKITMFWNTTPCALVPSVEERTSSILVVDQEQYLSAAIFCKTLVTINYSRRRHIQQKNGILKLNSARTYESPHPQNILVHFIHLDSIVQLFTETCILLSFILILSSHVRRCVQNVFFLK